MNYFYDLSLIGQKNRTIQIASYEAALILKPGLHLGSVYTRRDPFGTSTKLVRISLVFTRPGGSGMDRICYLVPSESIYEGDK